jgi:hypothetical protein
MTTAPAAVHFCARHAVTAIDGGRDRTLDWCEEAGPAGAALEFALGDKQRLTAPRTREGPFAMFREQRARSRVLGAMAAENCVLLGRQDALPFVVGLGNSKLLLGHRHPVGKSEIVGICSKKGLAFSGQPSGLSP